MQIITIDHHLLLEVHGGATASLPEDMAEGRRNCAYSAQQALRRYDSAVRHFKNGAPLLGQPPLTFTTEQARDIYNALSPEGAMVCARAAGVRPEP